MYAIFTMRKLQLTQRINQLQYRQMQLSQRLMDLATYAGNVADGILTPGEFMSSPASIFGVQMNFLNSSIPKALFQAGTATNMYMTNIHNMNMLNISRPFHTSLYSIHFLNILCFRLRLILL